MIAASRSHPSTAEVEAAMETLFRSEPTAPISLWRPSFDALTLGLKRARAVRDRTRVCVIAIIATTAIALLFLCAPAPTPAEIAEQSTLTPLMAAGRWVPPELQGFLVATSLSVIAAEYALSRIFRVLTNESNIVSLLRYYGSEVQDEEAML